MINSSRRNNSKWVIGPYYLIQNLKKIKSKFTTHWLGPYEISNVYDNGSIKLQTIDDEASSFIVNGFRLKLYNKPVNKEDVLQQISQQHEMEVLDKHIPMSPSHFS